MFKNLINWFRLRWNRKEIDRRNAILVDLLLEKRSKPIKIHKDPNKKYPKRKSYKEARKVLEEMTGCHTDAESGYNYLSRAWDSREGPSFFHKRVFFDGELVSEEVVRTKTERS